MLLTNQPIYLQSPLNIPVGYSQFSFIQYSRINENGKSIKSLENFNTFYSNLKEQYHSQTKLLLQKDLPWIEDNTQIKQTDCVCYYCGINERILSDLYIDESYTCKTKEIEGLGLS